MDKCIINVSDAPYFSFRLSLRGLSGRGTRSCTAAIRTAASHPSGSSRRCPPPPSPIWRRWSHTGCPRAPRTTSAALPRRYGDNEIKKNPDPMVINTYVSCLISNKHIIIHPVPLTVCSLQDKRSRDFTHTYWETFLFIQNTWVMLSSVHGCRLGSASCCTRHHVSLRRGGGETCVNEAAFKALIVCFPAPVLRRRNSALSLITKYHGAKEWHRLSCSSFEVKKQGHLYPGGAEHHWYSFFSSRLIEVRKSFLPWNKNGGFTDGWMVLNAKKIRSKL